ncbi:hypothetical protein D5018_17095 [Parashewanella curva]|uniref:Uncharacterized protein n=1 Tax=Parashewanella curva TaxID=2338552 RepID=A0A3L8PSS3_9GAMM|nr:hypothetical protein [Parashewanella curva]RLV58467.1 hypothetical protein D5018_17095 [Parashewanella curva]
MAAPKMTVAGGKDTAIQLDAVKYTVEESEHRNINYKQVAFDIGFNVAWFVAVAALEGTAAPLTLTIQLAMVIFFSLSTHSIKEIMPKSIRENPIADFTIDTACFTTTFAIPSSVTATNKTISICKKLTAFFGARIGAKLNIVAMDYLEVKKGTATHFIGKLVGGVAGGVIATWMFDFCVDSLKTKRILSNENGDTVTLEDHVKEQKPSDNVQSTYEHIRVKKVSPSPNITEPSLLETVDDCIEPETITFADGEKQFLYDATGVNPKNLANLTFEIDTNTKCKMTMYLPSPGEACHLDVEAYVWASEKCLALVKCGNGKFGIRQNCFLPEGNIGPTCLQIQGTPLTHHLLQVNEGSFLHKLPFCKPQEPDPTATYAFPEPTSSEYSLMLESLLNSRTEVYISEGVTAYPDSSNILYLTLDSTSLIEGVIQTIFLSEDISKIVTQSTTFIRPSSIPSPSPNPNDCTIYIIVGGVVLGIVVTTALTITGLALAIRKLLKPKDNEDLERLVDNDSSLAEENIESDEAIKTAKNVATQEPTNLSNPMGLPVQRESYLARLFNWKRTRTPRERIWLQPINNDSVVHSNLNPIYKPAWVCYKNPAFVPTQTDSSSLRNKGETSVSGDNHTSGFGSLTTITHDTDASSITTQAWQEQSYQYGEDIHRVNPMFDDGLDSDDSFSTTNEDEPKGSSIVTENSKNESKQNTKTPTINKNEDNEPEEAEFTFVDDITDDEEPFVNNL